jgi:hypothetical protein
VSFQFFPTCFRPISLTAAGRRAVRERGYAPCIDGSCRREPDREARFPTITAWCRPTFAPRVNEGDRVAYFTVSGRYPTPRNPKGHYLVAVWRVERRLESHTEAARWYRERSLRLPSTCLVPGNPPIPYDGTNQRLSKELGFRVRENPDWDHDRIVRLWDGGYARRAEACGVVLVCKSELLELTSPPLYTVERMTTVFGRLPGLQNPPKMGTGEYEALMASVKEAYVAPPQS